MKKSKYLVVSNNEVQWDSILCGCFVNIIEAESAEDAVRKMNMPHSYAVGQVYEPYVFSDGTHYPNAISVLDSVPSRPNCTRENEAYVMGVHKLYNDFRNLKLKAYAVGLQSGGLMECPEVTIDGVEIIIARNPWQACDIYNFKHKCDFFHGSIAADIVNGKPTNVSRYVKLDYVLNALDKFRNEHIGVCTLDPDTFDDIFNGKSDISNVEEPTEEPDINDKYRDVCEDLLKKMKANPDGLVGVSCKVELKDGRAVHIYASEDDDIVCVRKSEVAKLLHDIDTETVVNDG